MFVVRKIRWELKRLNTEFNKIIEEVTGKEAFKKYSDARARLEGKQKDGGLLKRIGKQFTNICFDSTV